MNVVRDFRKYQYSNFENRVNSTVKTVDALFDDRNSEDYDGSKTALCVGDIVHIGDLPKNCYVTDITILVYDGFGTDTKVDLAFIGDFPSTATTLICEDILIANGDTSIKIPLPTSGVAKPDGSNIGTDGGGIWNDDLRAMPLAILLKNENSSNGTPLVGGRLKLLFSYVSFDVNDFDRAQVIK